MNVIQQRTRQHKSRQGFSLVEVMLALVIFTMMTLMFAAVFPVALRAAKYSANYSQAALIAQHKMDQVRGGGFDKLDYASLRGLGVVDALASAPSSVTPQAYSFSGVDNLLGNGTGTAGVFPPGSMAVLVVTDYSTSTPVTLPDGTTYTPRSSSSLDPGSVRLATILIRWQGAGTAPATYTASALIVKHQ